MQIHELTLKRKTQVDEGIMDMAKGAAAKVGQGVSKVAGGIDKAKSAVSGIKGAYQGARVDQKTNAIADKAYRAWTTYRQQLDKTAPGGKADPATVEKQLMAFVQKNLLGGQYIPNLINKDQILGLVKQIATGGQPTTAPAVDKEQPPAEKQAAAQKNAAVKKAPAVTKPKTTAKAPVGKTAPGGAGAFGQMAGQLGGTTPATKTTSTGGTATTTPTGVKHTASATNPNQPVQSMADFTKQNPTAKYHEVTGEITPYGQQQAAVKAQADKDQQAATAAKYKQQAAAAETPPVAPAPTTTAPATTAPSTAATFDPTDKKAVAAFKKQMKGLKGTQGTVPSTPAGEPVSIGGQKLNPKDPAQAELIKKAQAAAAAKPIQEAANPQELELFKKLVAVSAQAQSEVETGQEKLGKATVKGADTTTADPRALAGQVQNAEKQGGVPPAVLAKAGQILRDTFKKGDPEVRKTGDAAVDALLLSMGFQI